MPAPYPGNSTGVDSSGILAALNDLASAMTQIASAFATFTRPNNATAYASGQLIANNTTPGSVVPLSFAVERAAGLGAMIRRVRFRKSQALLTNAMFRLHLYNSSPTVSNGDGGAWLTNNVAGYLGSIDVVCDRSFTDGASGVGIPNIGSEIGVVTGTVFGLIEARAAYACTNNEVFTINLEMVRN